MSKKQKRKVSQGNRQQEKAVASTNVTASPAEHQAPVRSYTPPTRSAGASRWTGSTAGSGSRRFMPMPEFNPDYSNVTKDLKRIGILAGSFFGLLIILSFIIK